MINIVKFEKGLVKYKSFIIIYLIIIVLGIE